MTLKEFRKHIETFRPLHVFPYGISEPFSWRGSYNEVAFSVVHTMMDRAEVLRRIDMALTDYFIGHKGGVFSFYEHTPIHFEQDSTSWTDGDYCSENIDYIRSSLDSPISLENVLVNLMFNRDTASKAFTVIESVELPERPISNESFMTDEDKAVLRQWYKRMDGEILNKALEGYTKNDS